MLVHTRVCSVANLAMRVLPPGKHGTGDAECHAVSRPSSQRADGHACQRDKLLRFPDTVRLLVLQTEAQLPRVVEAPGEQ